jgi:hypothetical protein
MLDTVHSARESRFRVEVAFTFASLETVEGPYAACRVLALNGRNLRAAGPSNDLSARTGRMR